MCPGLSFKALPTPKGRACCCSPCPHSVVKSVRCEAPCQCPQRPWYQLSAVIWPGILRLPWDMSTCQWTLRCPQYKTPKAEHDSKSQSKTGTNETLCPLHSVSGRGVGGTSNLSQRGGVLFLEVPGVTHSCLQASRDSDSFFFFFLITLATFIRKVTVWHRICSPTHKFHKFRGLGHDPCRPHLLSADGGLIPFWLVTPWEHL